MATDPRTLVHLNVGGSSSDPANRFVGWRQLQPGGSVSAFVREVVRPILDLRPDAVSLWMPAGLSGAGPLQADQFLEARAAGMAHLVNGFAAAWRPITRQVEVIGYTGSPSLDDDFGPLNLPGWLRRAASSLEPFVDAGMSLAWDASAGIIFENDDENDDKTARLIQLAGEFGVRNYVEPCPGGTSDWAFGLPCFMTESFYQTVNAHGWPDWARQPDEGEWPELIRIADGPKTFWSETWEEVTGAKIKGWIERVNADGHSVCLGADLLKLARDA